MNAIVLTFDRLALSFLGCYGNAWIATPQFDRLAAESIVFDQHYGENFDPSAEGHAWWDGRFHFPRKQGGPPDGSILWKQFKRRGVRTVLLSEPYSIGPVSRVPTFEETTICGGADGLDVAEDQTPFAHLAAEAERWLHNAPKRSASPWLLWLKSRGVPSPWLPPRQLVTRYLDRFNKLAANEGTRDGGPPDDIESDEVFDAAQDVFERVAEPQQDGARSTSEPTESADRRQRMARCVYAGYVALLDRGLGRLLDAVDRVAEQQDTLFVVTAAEGESFGIPTAISGNGVRLGESIVHTPLLLHAGEQSTRGRRQTLVQTVDLLPTLCDWLGVEMGECVAEGQSLLPQVGAQGPREGDCICLGNNRRGEAIRTSSEYLVRWRETETSDEPSQTRLFVKPDDLWEVHDVSPQAPDVVAQLSSVLDQFIAAAQQDGPLSVPRLNG